ncbi:carbon-nitrogen hydrolase family protein [Spirosoma migulaei]
MKICVAQTRPVKGDIERNRIRHEELIALAVSNEADIIIFPELSLTGYEPQLANELATDQNDSRFDSFQKISDTNNIIIGIGVPTQTTTGICISLAIFQPNQVRQTYSKKYLHADEVPFFKSGQNLTGLLGNEAAIALAICYELSVPEHAEDAFKQGAKIYIASVAKSIEGVEKATQRLAEIAATYSMTVFMSNCVGRCDDFDCGGKTSIWNTGGLLVGQLNDSSEGILLIDTETQEITERILYTER